MRYPKTRDKDGREIIDETEAIKMIRYAIDHGVNYFDTAYVYGDSEEILGRALADGYREKVVVATKIPVGDVKSRDDYQAYFQKQMERLKTGCIDIYLMHCLDKANWEIVKNTDGIRCLEELKEQGKIKKFGFSFHGSFEVFQEVIDAYPWDICMIQLNILDQNHQAGVRGLEYAAQRGIPVVIMEPLKGGLLGGDPPENVKRLLENHAEKRSLVEWAMRWLYNFSEVKVVLSGVSSMDQLRDNIRIFDGAEADVLSESDLELIQNIKKAYEGIVKVGCTGCGYCMPCPAGVNIPEIFKIYNDAGLSPWDQFGKTFYSLVVAHSGGGALNCMECGRCEKKCPQHIPIINTLKEAHNLMKSE
jgi:predicted aldo/keto reductase-like oxidoreductase